MGKHKKNKPVKPFSKDGAKKKVEHSLIEYLRDLDPDTKVFMVLPDMYAWGGKFASVDELTGYVRRRIKNVDKVEADIIRAMTVPKSAPAKKEELEPVPLKVVDDPPEPEEPEEGATEDGEGDTLDREEDAMSRIQELQSQLEAELAELKGQ